MVYHTDRHSNDRSFGNGDSIDDCCPLTVAVSPEIGTKFDLWHNVMQQQLNFGEDVLLYCWRINAKTFLQDVVKIGDFLCCFVESGVLHTQLK